RIGDTNRMNPGRQDEQAIRDWLAADAPFELDELVLDATYARTRRTRQSGWPWARRTGHMNRTFAFATGAVAIAIVVVGAALMLRSPSASVGNQPSSAPASALVVASPSSLAANPSPSTTAAATPRGSSLGLAILARDGTVRQDLALPGDTWMADLSHDGTQLAFLTRSHDVGFCGGCVEGVQRLAILRVGEGTGAFVYPDSDPSGGSQ